MAKLPAKFAADEVYEVKLARPVVIGRIKLLPSNRNRIKGKVAEQIRDHILEAKKV